MRVVKTVKLCNTGMRLGKNHFLFTRNKVLENDALSFLDEKVFQDHKVVHKKIIDLKGKFKETLFGKRYNTTNNKPILIDFLFGDGAIDMTNEKRINIYTGPFADSQITEIRQTIFDELFGRSYGDIYGIIKNVKGVENIKYFKHRFESFCDLPTFGCKNLSMIGFLFSKEDIDKIVKQGVPTIGRVVSGYGNRYEIDQMPSFFTKYKFFTRFFFDKLSNR